MPQINYSLKVGPKFDLFGLKESNPNNPILIADNKGSDFSLSRVQYNESDSHLKLIKNITTSARKTRIVSNTADMMMTDIFYYEDEDEEAPIYLFYKVKKRKLHKPKIRVNGEEAKYVDNHFIYLNDTEALVEYYNQDDELLLSEYQEVYPVFIWQEQINHKEIIDIDNKKYSFKLSRGNVIVSASKPNVHAEVKLEPIYKLKRVKEFIVKLEPFYLNTLRSNEEGRLQFEYNYLTIVPDVTTRRLEQAEILGGNIIFLENIDVLKRSLKIYRKKNYSYVIDENNIDDPYRDYDVLLDNESGMYDNIIHSSKGEIDASVLLRDNIVNYGDITHISYQYVRTNNILKIETEDVSLKNQVVYFSIKPTKISKQGTIAKFPPELSYIILDKNGNISILSDGEIPKYEYELPLYLGYGKGVYWGHSDPEYTVDPNEPMTGYSGTTSDFQTIVVDGSGLGSDYGTGWGELGYSEGPFGGSFLKDINDIQDLLDIKNNAEAGMISVGMVAFIPEIKTANIFPYKNVSIVDNDMNRRDLYNYNNIVWHNSIDGQHSDLINKSPVDIIKTYATIFIEPYIQFQDDEETIVEFDLSQIKDLYGPNTNIKDEFILNSTVSSIADADVNIYEGLMPSVSNKITDIVAFTQVDSGDYQEVNKNIMISHDYSKATMKFKAIDLDNVENIGLGFMNSDIKIYPTLTINL